jgi:2-methylisocitrate lyase-like PEP mutase family enzyme
MNQWDSGPADRLAASDVRFLEPRGAAAAKVLEMRAQAAKMLPDEWLTEGAVVGSVARCVERLREYRQAGADEILIHGLTSDRLAPVAAGFGA